MSGLLISITMLAAGGAIDYTIVKNRQAELQSATDAAALSAAALTGANDTERLAKAQSLFLGSEFCRRQGCDEPQVSMSGSEVVIQGTADVDTYFLKVARSLSNLSTLKVGTISKASPVTNKPLDVMMVLDYSGSMNWSNKYQNMATAAKRFIDSADAQPDNNISIGVVPFSKYVLTPMQGQYLYDVKAGNNLIGSNVVGCVLNREHPHSTSVAAPNTAVEGSLWPVFSFATGSNPNTNSYPDNATAGPAQEPSEASYTQLYDGKSYIVRIRNYGSPTSPLRPDVIDTPGNSSDPFLLDGHGKFTIRVEPFVKTDPAPGITNEYTGPPDFAEFNGFGDSANWSTGNDDGLPASFSGDRLSEDLSGPCVEYATKKLWVRPLSKNFSQLKSAIDDMRPLGWTNIALGLDIGWHALTPDAPFTQGGDSDTQKVAILLTDGVQTVKAHGPGNAVSITSANSNIAESCAAMKADNVEVFTIAFGIRNTYTRNLLKDCASTETHYYEPSQGGNLDSVFEGIFEKIMVGNVRLTG